MKNISKPSRKLLAEALTCWSLAVLFLVSMWFSAINTISASLIALVFALKGFNAFSFSMRALKAERNLEEWAERFKEAREKGKEKAHEL